LNTVLTKPQNAVLEFMRAFEEKERCAASTRVLAKGLGYRSQNSVIKHLRALAKKGMVLQLADKSWAVVRVAGVKGFMEVPLYGSIAAGVPADAEQANSEKILIDPLAHGLSLKGNYWALRVRGDSMADAHIVDGDIAIIEQREARSGEIIAALVDDTTTTLKRLVIEKGRAILRAANSRYPDVEPATLSCQGVLVSLIGKRGTHEH
jgi:repressor LexA